MQVDKHAQVRSQVAAHLELHGWKMLSGVAIAMKEVDTAVGQKTAHAYIGKFQADSENWTLTGSYWSEGRNVLEPAMTLIPTTADEEKLRACVEAFAEEAERYVAQSYAVKLRREHGIGGSRS
jgi:hypothetical protein